MQPPLEWTTADLVFLPQFDADHQTLFARAETVRLALTTPAVAHQVVFDVFRLAKSFSVHAKDEEKCMRQSRYPGRQWHEHQHQAGRHKMARLLKAARGRTDQSVADALEEFTSWLRDHVNLADRMFAAHFRNNRRERLAS